MGSVATPLCIVFIIWLFRSDFKLRSFGSRALWIPAIWLAIIGSRPVACWAPGVASAGGDIEGNSANLVIQGLLILSAIWTLARRRVAWNEFTLQNKALLVLYVYFLISVGWSAMPLASFKRLFKDFGGVLIGMVLLTEEDPQMAIRTVFVRVSYLLFPLSVLFIKYYPSIGRVMTHSWENSSTGVCTQKNSLGETVLVFSLMIIWDLLALGESEPGPARKTAKRIRYLMLAIGAWLLMSCQSRTSLVCLVAGGMMLFLAPRLARMRNPKGFLAAIAAVVALLVVFDSVLGVSKAVLTALGRNSTLTGRTQIWELVRAQPINPLFGYGYYCFWDTDRGMAVQAGMNNDINEAHNGYLETYVDGGMIAVGLLGLLLLVLGKRGFDGIATGSLYGGVTFAFWTAAVLFNWSETDYFRLMPLWFTLVLVTLNPQPWRARTEREEIESFEYLESSQSQHESLAGY